MESKEQKWMKKIQRGNRRSFKRLYDRYASYAHRLAMAITKNSYDASDVVQETFIKVFRYAHTYDLTKPFHPWFYRILVNEAKRLFQQRSNEAIQMETTKIDCLKEPQKINSFDDLYIALEKLNEKEKIILVLKYVEGFTEKEIATMLELNVNTVKTRLYRARQKLKSIIEGIDLSD